MNKYKYEEIIDEQIHATGYSKLDRNIVSVTQVKLINYLNLNAMRIKLLTYPIKNFFTVFYGITNIIIRKKIAE